MSQFETLSLIISSLSILIALVAAFYTYKNLKEIRLQFFEQNRGNIIFYVDRAIADKYSTLVIKNFGNSPAKLLSLKTTPNFQWTDDNYPNLQRFNIADCKNIFLAPNQYILSHVDLKNSTQKTFQIEITYETCGKTITESYVIDLSFSHNLLEVKPAINSELQALQEISHSVQQLSRKFL